MDLEWYTFGMIMFGSLFFLLAIGIPVGFSLVIASIANLALLGGGTRFLSDAPGYFFHHLNSFAITCVPLFIMMALFAQRAGFGEDLFKSIGYWLRKLPGSLNVVGVATCAIFAAISGTSVATAASVGLVAIPVYKKYNYNMKLSIGALAAGGGLGILIPPSVAMIMYCIVTEQSIGHMFAGGFLPGIMTVGLFIIYIVIRCIMNPDLAPVIPKEALGENVSLLKSILDVLPLLGLIGLVLASIYLGVATPTESASIGAVGSAMIGLLYKRLTFKEILNAAIDGVRIGAFIILIFLGALALGHAAVRGGVSSGFCSFVVDLGFSPYTVLIMILFVLMFLGFFMDATPIILTTMPIFFPLATQMGFDPIYFGVICVMMLETATITPPVGFNLFVLKGIASEHASMGDIVTGSFPFVILYLLAIVLVILFPNVIMFLPNMMS